MLTVPEVAVNVAVLVPPAMLADAGTVRAELLFESETTTPPEGAAVEIVTVQVEAPLLPKLAGTQDRLLTTT